MSEQPEIEAAMREACKDAIALLPFDNLIRIYGELGAMLGLLPNQSPIKVSRYDRDGNLVWQTLHDYPGIPDKLMRGSDGKFYPANL